MSRLRHEWQALLTAIQFLTRVPVPGGMNRPDPDRSLLRSSVRYYPLIGGGIGGITAGVALLAAQLWPISVAVALALTFEVWLTGGFHEDAVADCCDAFGGGWTRDDILRILKDSRVGSFGGLGLALALLIRWSAFAAVPTEQWLIVGLASGGLGRWSIVLLMTWIPPVAERSSLAKDVGERMSVSECIAASGLALPATIGWGMAEPMRLLLGIGLLILAVLGWGRYLWRRIHGVTGDCLGLMCYGGQLLILLTASFQMPRG